MIKAVYFDLDDTLCGYWSASRRGLREAFASFNIDPDEGVLAWREVFGSFAKEIKTDKWYQHYLESGEKTRTEHLRRTLARMGKADDELAMALSVRYAQLRNEYLVLFEDVIPILTLLQQSYPLGLITNGPADIQRQEIDRLGIESFFKQILIEGEFKIGKPDLEIFRAAEEFCGLPAEAMLFVGNAYEHDVQGAKRAGWSALWLNRGSESDKSVDPLPDRVIENLYEVCDFLGINRPEGALPQIAPESISNWR